MKYAFACVTPLVPFNKTSRQPKEANMEILKCALYGRVSTHRQAVVQEGGLDTQFKLMEKRIELENQKEDDVQWAIADRYREEGWSGKNTDRPEYQRMMRDIDAGKIDIVIVQKIDRVTRSLRDFYDLWETLEKAGVQFVSVNENFDTTTAMGRAMLKFILVFAELERETTAERTTATMRHRAEQGLWFGGRRLGYEKDPDKKSVLKVNADEARIVVEEIFEKCVELGSAGQVTKHLAALGIRRPTFTSKRGQLRGGGPYYKDAVLRMLTDKVYLGKLVFDGEEFDGQHEAIVEQSLFDRVQEILAKNREIGGNSRGEVEHVFLLQGLLRCGRCGSMMSSTWCTGRDDKKHFYYQCTRQSHSARTMCDARYAPALAIEEFVIQQVAEWGVQREQIERAIELACKHHNDEANRIGIELNDVKRRLRETKTSLSKLVAAVASGADFRSFEDQIRELEQVRDRLEDRIQSLEIARSDAMNQSLSADVIASTYCDFPFVVEKLRAAGNENSLKDVLACYIASIDLFQDEKDPQSGNMDIMVFEEELPIPWSKSVNENTLRPKGVNHLDRRVSSKLPD